MKAFMLSLVVLAGSTCFAQNKAKTSYDNGAVKSEYVKKGELVAITNYYESGEVKEEGFFKDGIPEGKWETFSKEGAKTAELTYVEGQRHGEFRVWDEFDNAYIEMRYDHGKVVSANRYLKQTEFAIKDK
jgi:antitoxin component YwqK of YwqJK toxin-antitoxin module